MNVFIAVLPIAFAAQGVKAEIMWNCRAMFDSAPVPESILHVTTRLVDVSAVVLDKHGNPVPDLKKEDFEVFDDGKRQDIRLFSSSAAGSPVSTADAPVPVNLRHSPAIFSNVAGDTSRHNAVTVLLVDYGIAAWGDQVLAEERLIQFVREVQPGERLGLYVPRRDGVGIVREFTSDSSNAAADLKAWYRGAALQSEADIGGWQDNPECSANHVLKAITATANHLAGVAGHKNLIWFSGGHELTQPAGASAASGAGAFPTFVHTPDSPEIPQNCFKEEREALRAANAANMALYSIDLRGLQTLEPDATVGAKDIASPRALNGLLQAKLTGLEKDQSIMRDVADRTGGRSFTETNDILGALRTSMADSHAAYSLGFYPESSHFDGRYHTLEVRVASRPDVTVHYRRGYVDAAEQNPDVQLREALENPLDADAIALSAEMIAAKGGGYDVKLNIGVGSLDLHDENGRWRGQARLLLVRKDETGGQLDHWDGTLQLNLTPDRYEALRGTGLIWHQALPPNREAASLRVIVRDEAGHLGSVTIPLNASRKR